MAVRDVATLKANMPIAVPGGTSVQDILDVVDTVFARTPINVEEYGVLGNKSADIATSLQLAHDTLISAGGGVLFIPAGDYLLGSTVNINSLLVSIVGAGVRATKIYTENCGTSPAFSFTGGREGCLGMTGLSLYAYNDGIHNSISGTENGSAHANFRVGSKAIQITDCVGVNFTNIDCRNFDTPTVFGVGGNTWMITFRDCVFGGGNKGAVIQGYVENSFERMIWDTCQLSGNNYGAYIDLTLVDTGSGGGSVFLTNCSIDYCAIRHIWYKGTANNVECNNVLTCQGGYYETNQATSGMAVPRIYAKGVINLIGTFFYEMTTPPVGYVDLQDGSRGGASNCMFVSNATPKIFYNIGVNDLAVSGGGNRWQGNNEVVLSHTARGSVLDDPETPLAYAEHTGTWALSAGEAQAQKRTQYLNRTGSWNIDIPLDPTDVTAFRHANGIEITYVTINTGTFTFVPASGVTLTTQSGKSPTVTGADKSVTLFKYANNTWRLRGDLNSA